MTDNRVMSHMDSETRIVHARLEEWAKWFLGRIQVGPITCNLGKVIQYGPTGAGHKGVPAPEPEVPSHVVMVEKAVCKLRDVDSQAIRVYYGNRSLLIGEVAQRMRPRMNLSQFRNVLRRARWRVGGYLAAFE